MTDARATPSAALSSGAFADAYDRGRPPYPRQAAAWLVGTRGSRVLELGAGTGKLTGELLGLGHDVVASDPQEPMLRLLTGHHPAARAVLAAAERIPLAPRSVDAVVSAQAFDCFDLSRALPEIARVLRPGGRLALAWNHPDERVPWVRRLGHLLAAPEQAPEHAPEHAPGQPAPPTAEPSQALIASQLFGFVEEARFRFWQPTGRQRLRDLALSRSHVATLPQTRRDRLLADVEELYDGYGRGPDGMLMPYETRCYRATVRAPALPGRGHVSSGEDPDSLLIDFG